MLRICKKIDDYEKEQAGWNINNLIFIAFKHDGVYLNEAKLIDKRAKLQIAILKILMEKHLVGNLYFSRTGLNTVQISYILEKEGFSYFDLEKYVRQSIHRIKKNISEKYNHEISENFIQSSKLTGQYRLGKNVVLICM